MNQVTVWKDMNIQKNEDQKVLFQILSDMGVEAKLEVSDYGTVKELVLAKGKKKLRFGSGFNIARVKPTTKDVWVLEGTMAGMVVHQTFDTAEQAQEQKSKLEASCRECVLGYSRKEIEVEGEVQ